MSSHTRIVPPAASSRAETDLALVSEIRLRFTPPTAPVGRTRAAAGALQRLARTLAPSDALFLDFAFGEDPDSPLMLEVGLAGGSRGGAAGAAPVEADTADIASLPASVLNSKIGEAKVDTLPSTEALRRASALAIPGLELCAGPPTQAAEYTEVFHLRPVPVTPLEYSVALSRRFAGALPEPDPVPRAPQHRLALAHPEATPARLVNALHILAGLDNPATLRLACRPVLLAAADLRPIGLVAGFLRKSLQEALLPLPERIAVSQGVARLEAWQAAAAGVALELSVSSPGPLEPWLIACLQDALFASSTPDERIFERDLTVAAPDGASLPAVFPSAGALLHMSRMRADALRKEHHPESDRGVLIDLLGKGLRCPEPANATFFQIAID